MIFFNNWNQIYNAILKNGKNFNLFTEWNFGASVRRDGWCEESYKIYWEDIARIELILLGGLNETQPISWTAQTLKYFLIFLKIYSLVFIEWFYHFLIHALSCFSDMIASKGYHNYDFHDDLDDLDDDQTVWVMIIVWYQVENCSATADRHPYHIHSQCSSLAFAFPNLNPHHRVTGHLPHPL